MESMESDSELEELQDDPLLKESLLRSGLNRRYLNFILVSTSLDKFRHEIIGMDFDDQHYRLGHVYSVGCLGKIIENKKANDGTLQVNLVGVTRFEIKKEIDSEKPYRIFNVSYDKFGEDLNQEKKQLKKTKDLSEKIKIFFEKNGLLLNWKEFNKLDQDQRINTLAMIAPISNEEKQTLLETVKLDSKIKTLSEIIEFYLHDKRDNNLTIQ